MEGEILREKCLKGIHISRAIAPLNVPETSGYQKYRYFDPYIFISDVENSHTDKKPKHLGILQFITKRDLLIC